MAVAVVVAPPEHGHHVPLGGLVVLPLFLVVLPALPVAVPQPAGEDQPAEEGEGEEGDRLPGHSEER